MLADPSRRDLAWTQMSTFTRLAAVATVCNKARFLQPEGEGAGGASAGAPLRLLHALGYVLTLLVHPRVNMSSFGGEGGALRDSQQLY